LKLIGLIVVIATGLLLLWGVTDFPDWADPQSPASTHLSPHFLTESIEETAVPNVVTSVLGDYRGFDTMLETTVVFAAGIAVYTLLRRSRRKDLREKPEMIEEELPHQALIVKTICRLMAPFMQLYALYVIAHGHHSPGGGFQGGVILGASFILLAIGFDLKMVLKRMREKTTLVLGILGVLIFSGIGMVCVLLEKNFLDYSALSAILPATDIIMARSHGILGVEIGVALAVMANLVLIYVNLSSDGKYERGL
jgi:multicomponent Na+:H+ antiporter subunit B